MSEVAEWGLIGPGHIGNELMRQLGQDYVGKRLDLSTTPSFVLRSSGLMEGDGVTPSEFHSLSDIDEFPEVTFIAMPSTDDGIVANEYIETILSRGKIAVTAEKGALSNNFDGLRERSEDFTRLGVNATVGGGTRMLEVGRQYAQDIDNISQIHLALNGTLAAIMSYIAPPEGSGMSLGQAVKQAVNLGYAEPGAETPYDVIRGEAEGDIPKKTAILFNRLGLTEGTVDWKDFQFELENESISEAVAEAKIRRFIVSVYSKSYLDRALISPRDEVLGGFSKEVEGWNVVAGFQHVNRNPLFYDLSKITGPGNGMVIGLGPDETDGVYSVTGPGAGVSPTVNTMIDDYVGRKAAKR